MKKIVIIAALVCGAWQQADAQYVSKVWVPDQQDGTYINPIIHADYSDPDVCAAGDDFYMTASSFGCAPGLPILCLLYTSPSPRDAHESRMPSSA